MQKILIDWSISNWLEFEQTDTSPAVSKWCHVLCTDLSTDFVDNLLINPEVQYFYSRVLANPVTFLTCSIIKFIEFIDYNQNQGNGQQSEPLIEADRLYL